MPTPQELPRYAASQEVAADFLLPFVKDRSLRATQYGYEGSEGEYRNDASVLSEVLQDLWPAILESGNGI